MNEEDLLRILALILISSVFPTSTSSVTSLYDATASTATIHDATSSTDTNTQTSHTQTTIVQQVILPTSRVLSSENSETNLNIMLPSQNLLNTTLVAAVATTELQIMHTSTSNSFQMTSSINDTVYIKATNTTMALPAISMSTDSFSSTLSIQPTTNTPTTSDNGDDGLETGAVVGIAIGGFIGVVLIIVFSYMVCHKKKKKSVVSILPLNNNIVEMKGKNNDGYEDHSS